MERRYFLRRTGATLAGSTMLAGCANLTGSPSSENDATSSRDSSPSRGDTLRIATYSSFTGEGAAGNWLKSAFESDHPDVTIEFVTPKNGLNQYVRRAQQGVPIDVDLYVGLNTGELVRADESLDEPLFRSVAHDIDGADDIKDALRIDPTGRALPYDTGYICLVYDEDDVRNPGTFDALLKPAYESALITENAQQSDPGRAFLLWTIAQMGFEGSLDYWRALLDNGVTILSDWEMAYSAYMNGEAPMVVSYSTDQVYYHGPDVDMSNHQVGFLNDQGYANPEAMALFQASTVPELGKSFMEFVLTDKAQAEIARRNVQFPAVKGVDPGKTFSKYAYEPPEAVTFTYDELVGNVRTWIEEWARLVASR